MLLDALDKKLLFQTLHWRSFLPPLSREPLFLQYLILYIFFCYCIHYNTLEDAECIRLIQEVHHTWGKCPEFIFCLKSCWWLLLSTKVSASTRKHQWYPLPILPSFWVFPTDCNKKSYIFPHTGAIRHGSVCWTINKGDARTFNVVTVTCFNIFISHTPVMWIYHLQMRIWHFLRVDIQSLIFLWNSCDTFYEKNNNSLTCYNADNKLEVYVCFYLELTVPGTHFKARDHLLRV